jgi:GPH family glycoside/pentoside/hexuronide:cation symporter
MMSKTAQAVSAERPQTGALTVGLKLGYGVGDFAFNLVIQTTALYLMYFFTDVFGIPAAAAGTIFLVSKFWDAGIDPGLGVLVDSTRTRWGKMRPYLLFGAAPLGLSVFLLFLGPSLPPAWKIVYSYATFIFFCTAISLVNIPYVALTAVLTTDSRARSGLSAYRMSLALLGTLLAGAITKPLVGLASRELLGFRLVGALYGLLAAGVTLITFLSVREGTEAQARDKTERRIGFRATLRVLTANPPFMLVVGGMFLFMTAIGMMAGTVTYYFKYNLQAEGLVPVAFLAMFVTAILCIPLFVRISNRTSKRTAFVLGMSSMAALLVVLYFFGERNRLLTILIFVAAGFGMSSIYLCPWSMLPDTVEYSQWRTGHRREGILFGTYFLFIQVGGAVAGFLVGTGLDLTGYTPNVAQSPRALAGIRFLISLGPVVLVALGLVAISFYSITAERHRQILQEIEQGG